MSEMYEQLTLNIDNGSPIKVLCKLHKSQTPIASKVSLDQKVEEVAKNFDYDFNGESKFYPYEFPKILNDIDYNILCVVGASGTQSPQYGVIWKVANGRTPYSFKYVGDMQSELVDDELMFHKKNKIEKITLF